jgi:hypothetical protein
MKSIARQVVRALVVRLVVAWVMILLGPAHVDPFPLGPRLMWV